MKIRPNVCGTLKTKLSGLFLANGSEYMLISEKCLSRDDYGANRGLWICPIMKIVPSSKACSGGWDLLTSSGCRKAYSLRVDSVWELAFTCNITFTVSSPNPCPEHRPTADQTFLPSTLTGPAALSNTRGIHAYSYSGISWEKHKSMPLNCRLLFICP